MRPKRGSSGAWGTTSAGKLVVEAIVLGDRWLAILLIRAVGEGVTKDLGTDSCFVDDDEGGMVGSFADCGVISLGAGATGAWRGRRCSDQSPTSR